MNIGEILSEQIKQPEYTRMEIFTCGTWNFNETINVFLTSLFLFDGLMQNCELKMIKTQIYPALLA